MLKKELQIFTYYDLLSLYPFRYIDRSKFYKVKEINEELPYVQLKGKIVKTELLGEKQSRRFVAYLKDDTGVIELVWFQGAKWLEGKFKPDTEYIVLGKPTEFRSDACLPQYRKTKEQRFRQQRHLKVAGGVGASVV